MPTVAKKQTRQAPAGTNRKPYSKSPVITPHSVLIAFTEWKKAAKTADELEEKFNTLYNQYATEVLGGEENLLLPKLGRPTNSPVEKATRSALGKEAVTDEVLDSDRVEKMTLTELRQLAVRLKLDETRIKAKILAELESKGLLRGPDDEDDDEDERDIEESDGEDEESEDETDEVEDDEDEEDITREELEGMSLKELKAFARENEVEFDKNTDKESLIDLLMEEGDEDEDDEEDSDESDDEEDDEDDDESYTREDLEEMTLKELKAAAKAEGHPLSSYKDADKEDIIDLILGEDEEDDEEDDEDEDEETLVIDEEDLRKMSAAELRDLCKQLEIPVPKKIFNQKAALVTYILENTGDEE